MKRCPTCNRSYTERDLSYCIDDGTPLVSIAEEDSTVVSPSNSHSPSYGDARVPPAYQPPGSYSSGDSGSKRSAWPWVVGIGVIALAGIVGLGVAAAFLVPNLVRSSRNQNRETVIVNQQESADNENSNSNANTIVDADNAPPTDPAKVLSDLTDLEHEWTVANINADKKALGRILADDYVGLDNGRKQGKREYLDTLQRNTSIEKWEFQDLKVNLLGDRATLTGILKLVASGQEASFRFTDKFVWRDRRWQATGSEVKQVN
jgi:hypothetical protein